MTSTTIRRALCWTLCALTTLAACPGPTPPAPRDPTRRGRSGAQTLAQQAVDLPRIKVHFIDVGQGDAILLELPCGAVLIDTGGEKTGDFDSNKVLDSYLGAFFARRKDLHNTLDLVAISHPHYDHVRGIKGVLLHPGSRLKIRNVITNGKEQGPGAWQQRLLHRWASSTKGVKLRKILVEDIPQGYGLTGPVIDPIRCRSVDPKIRVLWGAVTRRPKDWDYRAMDNPHNHCLALRVDFGKLSFLFPGDLEEDGLNQLGHWSYPSRLLDVDVLKVPGHGSARSASPGILKIASPKLAVISVGPYNRRWGYSAFKYGHPRISALKLLQHYVTRKRLPQKAVFAFSAPRRYKKTWIERSIYATAWDGNVVIEGATNGWLRKVP